MKIFDRQNPHFWAFRYINVHFWPRESIRRGRFTPLQCSFNFFDLLKVDFKQFSTFWPTFDLQNRRFFSYITILETFGGKNRGDTADPPYHFNFQIWYGGSAVSVIRRIRRINESMIRRIRRFFYYSVSFIIPSRVFVPRLESIQIASCVNDDMGASILYPRTPNY